jgi:rhodanese-related sulfurtransferase/uncharacterized membrane protein YphA (DoxX/SURF4 family)
MQGLTNIVASVWTYRSIRVCLGIIFVWAGVAKLLDLEAFAHVISAYELVPEKFLASVAIGLPVLELIAGFGLIFDVRGSLSIVLGLLLMFAFVLWFGILNDLDIDCGCYSARELKEHGALRSALYRDLGMIAGALYLFGWRWAYTSFPRASIPLKLATTNRVKGGNNTMCKRKALFVLLMCSMLTLGLATNGLCFGKKELDTEKIAVNLVREVERGGYKIVTTNELKAWIDDKKDMVVVDTMPYEASYKKGHVPGAVQFLFPIPEMPDWKTAETGGKTEEDFLKLLGPDKNKVIVIYCGFVKCTRSHNGAMWAVKLGYTNVNRYPGGIKAWKEAKYPAEKANEITLFGK